jgi:spore coat protein U-like protein
MNKPLKIALAIAAVIATGSVGAATATTTFLVTASVGANCLAAATTLAFGTYLPGNGPINQTSTVSVRCTTGTAFTVGLNAGTFGGATVTTRRMANGALPLSYSLYRDAARTLNWGTTIGTDTQAGAGLGLAVANAVPFTVYGQIPDSGANLAATVGAYTDTITVTVTY